MVINETVFDAVDNSQGLTMNSVVERNSVYGLLD
jgi:hypothetical protein